MNIVTDNERYINDPLLRSWLRKDYLSQGGWDTRLQSLIPPNFWYFDPEDKKTWYADTPSRLVNFDGTGTSYIILVRWWVETDPRGFIRLFRTKGWHRSREIRYYDLQRREWLEGAARKEFVQDLLEPRMKRVLGIKDLANTRMRRYRFNFACRYPDGDLRDRDGHHNVMDNPAGAERIRPDLVGLYDYWLLATDDRSWNIVPMTPETHNEEHKKLEDTRFEFYRRLNHENDSFQWNQETGFT